MDSGSIQRPAPAPSAAPVRIDSAPARPSAALESPPEKVVQPVGEANGVRMEAGQIRPRVAQALADIDRQQDFDKDADSLVVSWVNQKSGDVVHQFPTEQQLRIRAYWREQERQVEIDRQARKDDIVA